MQKWINDKWDFRNTMKSFSMIIFFIISSKIKFARTKFFSIPKLEDVIKTLKKYYFPIDTRTIELELFLQLYRIIRKINIIMFYRVYFFFFGFILLELMIPSSYTQTSWKT